MGGRRKKTRCATLMMKYDQSRLIHYFPPIFPLLTISRHKMEIWNAITSLFSSLTTIFTYIYYQSTDICFDGFDPFHE